MLGRQIEALAQQTADGGFGGTRKRSALGAAQRQKPIVDHQNLRIRPSKAILFAGMIA